MEFKSNVKSQWGEDGIIEEIFNRLGIESPICIEFGAWDGVHLSNVWNLWHNKGWNALLVEMDEKKYIELEEKAKQFPKLKTYCARVEAQGENSIGNIAKKMNLPQVIDLLSIDIDGNDYYVFQQLNFIKPRVIVIEYNPTIPPYLEIVQEPDQYFGASALALINLAKTKNYKFVAITDTNLFFVHDNEFKLLDTLELDIANCYISEHLTCVFTSYDGQPFLDKIPPYFKNGIPSAADLYMYSFESNPLKRKIVSSSKIKKSLIEKLPKFKSTVKTHAVLISKIG